MSDNLPGWYKDPAEPTTQRYWDGDGWIGDPLPADATPPDGPPPASPVASAAPSADRGTWVVPPPPSSAPPSSAPPSASPGANQPGAYPPGAYPPGSYPPGSYPPGPYPPGSYPPGAYPPGSYPPGAYPPGSYPPGEYPPGSYPPGAYPPGTPLGAPSGPHQPHPNQQGAVTPPPGWPPGLPFPYGPYGPILRPRPHGFDLAPLGSRLVARIVDILAVLVLNAVLNGYLVYKYVQETGPYWRAFVHASQNGGSIPTMTSRGATLGYVIVAFALVIWGVYEVPTTGRFGQTLGKRLLGIRVIGLEGKTELGGARSFRRWLPLGLPTLLWMCGLGFIIQLIDCLAPTINRPFKLALHDIYAATVVVAVPRKTDVPGHTDVGEPRKISNGGTS